MTRHSVPATWKFGALAVGAAVAASVVIAAAPARATDVPACAESDIVVAESGAGTGVYTASIRSTTIAECGVWLQTFTFDNGYVPVDASDYGHSQTATESEWVVLTPTSQTLTAVVPTCGPFQTDVSVGVLQLNLPNGDLGADWVAGSVGVRPLCEVVPPPVEASSAPTPAAAIPGTVTGMAESVPDQVRAVAVDDVVADKPAAELAATGLELWLLVPAALLILAGLGLLIPNLQRHH